MLTASRPHDDSLLASAPYQKTEAVQPQLRVILTARGLRCEGLVCVPPKRNAATALIGYLRQRPR